MISKAIDWKTRYKKYRMKAKLQQGQGVAHPMLDTKRTLTNNL
ncbi:MAG: hypothetical protein ABSA33_02625 [Candidatus Micrarchaeaceae archaeon]